MSSSSSVLFSDLSPASASSSSSISSSRSRPDYRRSSTFSSASTYSRDSWCSTADSECSVSSTTQGHISHDKDSLDKLVLANIASNAIFGSTSPRKSKSSGMRSSTESTRSWSSSSSSVRSPKTPLTPLFSHPERDVTQTPTLATVALPWVAEVPKLKRPHLSRIVSDEVQYIGRSLDVPVSEVGHEERVSPVSRRASNASTATSQRHAAGGSRFSTWNGKDGLMIAMDELEQELARTMVALSTSANTSPASTISKARGKSMRRPHTADKVMASSSTRSLGSARAEAVGSSSGSPASLARFQRESWMSSSSDRDEDVLRPIRFSASDLTLLSDSADLSKRSEGDSVAKCEGERPISHVSSRSSRSGRVSRAEYESPCVPALVFDGRSSGSSSSSGSFQEAPSRPDSFVTADNGHVTILPRTSSIRGRPSTSRGSPKAGFYELNKGARSSPSLAATSEPPRDPLPPLPSLPSRLSHLLASAVTAPPRPPKSSQRSSPVSFNRKPLPSLPC
ncbi:conserved hypothetical protein [Sporisorium reilianum SRZ2]|uniref:Uncharacterized protein n=1 Tax=Sporisorium reilianum (strain SRZ2) TaxID=999809 RepID=E6ZJM2_SPORE|nr:conserved hypothetical protein [Sporisorium reilianum SRZ2]